MKRENAIFQGSRLYVQAKEGKEAIYASLPKNFESICKTIIKEVTGGKDSIFFNNIQQLEDWIAIFQVESVNNCKRVSVIHSLPILMETIDDYYSSEKKEEIPWLGTALKQTVSFVWDNLENPSIKGDSFSLNVLINVIVISSVLQQLEMFRFIFITYGDFPITFYGYGFETSEELDELVSIFNASFRIRGAGHRTVNDTAQTILQKPEEAIQLVESILRGETLHKPNIFINTLFSEIPFDQIDFWCGLWARLVLAVNVSFVKLQITDEIKGVGLFGAVGIKIPQTEHKEKMQQALYDLFWNPEWYRRNIKKIPINMIVERPVVRISKEPFELFSTSFLSIVDSITWYVEASILKYEGINRVKLPDVIYNKYVSDPFEQQINKLLNKYGFSTGNVTDKNVWKNNNTKLIHPSNSKIPGEIDVLAYKPSANLVLVIECKVLAYPHEPERLRNIISKTGVQDSERFHSKLAKKVTWIEETNHFPSGTQIVGLIVLDRMFPIVNNGEHPVYSEELLKEFLEDYFIS